MLKFPAQHTRMSFLHSLFFSSFCLCAFFVCIKPENPSLYSILLKACVELRNRVSIRGFKAALLPVQSGRTRHVDDTDAAGGDGSVGGGDDFNTWRIVNLESPPSSTKHTYPVSLRRSRAVCWVERAP